MATTIPTPNQQHQQPHRFNKLSDTTIQTITVTKIKEHLCVITAADQATGRNTVEPRKETHLIIKIQSNDMQLLQQTRTHGKRMSNKTTRSRPTTSS
mgnify:CR=1 FL=1